MKSRKLLPISVADFVVAFHSNKLSWPELWSAFRYLSLTGKAGSIPAEIVKSIEAQRKAQK